MTNIPSFDLAFRSQISDLKRREKYALKELNTRVLKAILEKEPGSKGPINSYLTNTPPTQDLQTDQRNYVSKAKEEPNIFFDQRVRTLAENQLQSLKQNTLTRVRNRCVLSGRSSTLKKFRLSRIAFRELAGAGKLQGVTKRLHK